MTDECSPRTDKHAKRCLRFPRLREKMNAKRQQRGERQDAKNRKKVNERCVFFLFFSFYASLSSVWEKKVGKIIPHKNRMMNVARPGKSSIRRIPYTTFLLYKRRWKERWCWMFAQMERMAVQTHNMSNRRPVINLLCSGLFDSHKPHVFGGY